MTIDVKLRMGFSKAGLNLIRMLAAPPKEVHVLQIRLQISKVREALDAIEEELTKGVKLDDAKSKGD